MFLTQLRAKTEFCQFIFLRYIELNFLTLYLGFLLLNRRGTCNVTSFILCIVKIAINKPCDMVRHLQKVDFSIFLCFTLYLLHFK